MSKRGAFIVLEGLDRCARFVQDAADRRRSGKSTQVERLGRALSEAGHPAQTVRFPGASLGRDRRAVPLLDGHLMRLARSIVACCTTTDSLSRPHDDDRQDDRQLLDESIRAGRPSYPPALLRKSLGARVRSIFAPFVLTPQRRHTKRPGRRDDRHRRSLCILRHRLLGREGPPSDRPSLADRSGS